jgi:protein PsiE
MGEHDIPAEKIELHHKILHKVIAFIEFCGLATIAIATVYAAGQEVMIMIQQKKVGLGDLLLMFLYLEILAMISVYLKSGKLPIRFPIYIAIVALARYLIVEVKGLNELEIIAIAVTILLLTASVLIMRYGSTKLPYDSLERNS